MSILAAVLACGLAPFAARAGEEVTALSVLERSAKRTPWAQAFKVSSPHFTVITNTSQKLAQDISQALELQFKELFVRFQLGKPPTDALPVKIFAEKSEFQQYRKELGKRQSEHTAGYFDPNLKEIVLFWSDDPEDVLSTLYHEATHYVVEMFAPRGNVPVWLNEGLAVYFETAQFKNGKLETGQVPYGRLLELQDAVKQGKHHPLRRLMKYDNYDSYDLLAYAEGWSVVYYFAKNNLAQGFGAYLDEIKKGRDQDTAFKRAFGGATPDQLESVWKPWVLGLEMKSARGWYERALNYWYEDRNEDAVAACDEALKLDPKLSKAKHLKGRVLYWLRKMPEALEALEQACKEDPTDARSFFTLARVHEALCQAGDKRGAEAAQEANYLKAIQIRPDYADALGFLAWLYAIADDPKLRKIKQAIPIAERAVELDPTAEVLDTLAECYFQDGQVEKAVATARRALAMKPPDLEYYQNQLKKFEAALKR
ncbi:MAG: tetratricopeptide repeat protein [Planctomycetota bacterium]|nr:tetratricopeptide repeat protein [Planctomycetota bacterium]